MCRFRLALMLIQRKGDYHQIFSILLCEESKLSKHSC